MSEKLASKYISSNLKETKYKLISKIYSNKNSELYLGSKNDVEYAIKITVNNSKNKKNFLYEISYQNRCNKHPNVVKIYETIVGIKHLYIILEYCSKGTLKSITRELNWEEIKFYYSQVIKGLIYIHEQHIIHRDIKPNNILICGTRDEEVVKIIDFGLACDDDDKNQLNDFVGTLPYIAPEIYDTQRNNDLYYTNKVDIWSLGVSIYYSHTLKFPFEAKIHNNLHFKSYKLFFNHDYKKNITDSNILSLLKKIFMKDTERISLREILILFDEINIS